MAPPPPDEKCGDCLVDNVLVKPVNMFKMSGLHFLKEQGDGEGSGEGPDAEVDATAVAEDMGDIEEEEWEDPWAVCDEVCEEWYDDMEVWFMCSMPDCHDCVAEVCAGACAGCEWDDEEDVCDWDMCMECADP